MDQQCLICERPATVSGDSYRHTDCSRCGDWELIPSKLDSGSTFADLMGHGRVSVFRRSNLSAIVRRQSENCRRVSVPMEDLANWGLDEPLPKPRQQCDDLVRLIGNNQIGPADWVAYTTDFLEAWIGSPIYSDGSQSLGWLLSYSELKDLLRCRDESNGLIGLNLTYLGWDRYEAINRNSTESINAFMAMKFGDEILDSVVENDFKSAVKATGFTLKRLIDDQPAGLIDDQLRVQIRNSAFVIVDLSHENKGAYWEAGFAEGLGKPVIYTCRKDVWDNPETKPHFDTNHLVTIIWDPNDREDAAKRLKATIRATLPERAVMEDAKQ
jgi:nucleoside 2-deoxyribosyltransferase